MKFFSSSSFLATVGSLFLLGFGGVNAVCEPGDTNTVASFCDGKEDLEDPDDFGFFCFLVGLTGLDDVLQNDEEEFTLFAPTNQAFDTFRSLFNLTATPDDSLVSILQYHVIVGSTLPAVDALCSSFPPVSFGGKDNEGRLPKIRCVDDIVGRKSSFIVGPANKKGFGNLPRLSRGGEVLSEEKCNGIVYIVDNVIGPKLLKEAKVEPEPPAVFCGADAIITSCPQFGITAPNTTFTTGEIEITLPGDADASSVTLIRGLGISLEENNSTDVNLTITNGTVLERGETLLIPGFDSVLVENISPVTLIFELVGAINGEECLIVGSVLECFFGVE